MPFETFTVIALSALLAAAAVALAMTLHRGRTGAASAQLRLDEGRYREVLDTDVLDTGERDRDVLFAWAVAAKHLGELGLASETLARLVAEDPGDGEAWLETGLVAAYDGRLDDADDAFARVEASRSDLLESLTLHRAWLAALRGDAARAGRLFGEIEVPLETKLRQDIGEGEASFAEWFLHAGLLWRQRGDEARADWALGAARAAAPRSRLVSGLVEGAGGAPDGKSTGGSGYTVSNGSAPSG